MTVVTLLDYVPPARSDGVPWTNARIEESAAQTGPWTAIDELELSPVDVDPADPLPRDFTTEFATLVSGWYRVVFIDGTGDESAPSAPIQNTAQADITPSLRDVSALLRARINDPSSDVLTANTYPTAEQVRRLIFDAASDIRSRVATIPESQVGKARWLAALQTARLVELSYFPEQTNEDRSVYANLTALFNPALDEFITNCRTPMSTTLA